MDLIRRLRTRFRRRSERGQGLPEYALVIALVSIVTIGAVTELGQGLYRVYYDIVCALGGEESQTCDCGAGERVTVSPIAYCSGGMFSAQALTTCGENASLSLLFDYGGGDILEVGLSYDGGSGLFVTSFPDNAG
ncbi:MAG: Flp family type IVb pilin, partial [Aggregatilineales bacterium]